MKTVLSSLIGIAVLSFAFTAPPALRAADHGDAPTLGPDQGCDLADVYAFLDPNNNDNVILIGTVRGFIVPGEAGNFALFDPTARFTFGIENTGDSKPDLFIDVQFSPRTKLEDGSFSQTASVSLRGVVPRDFAGKGGKFDPVAVYQPTLAGTPNPRANFIVDLANTKNPTPGIKFFAGEVDDPFFFDIPGFNRFVSSAIAHFDTTNPNPPALDVTTLDRGRDSFAGYNVLSIAVSMPSSLLRDAKPKAGTTPPTKIGVNFVSARGSERTVKGVKVHSGGFNQVDRLGVPGVNVAFIPYNHKNAYNGASTVDDGKGAFLSDIGGTLTALGTDSAHIAALAGVVGLPPGLAPTKKPAEFGTGDFLRLETNKVLMPNAGSGGGGDVAFEDQTQQNPAHGFPNGRRLKDDVIDTVLFLVTNGTITAGDHVTANDAPLENAFPFLALPQQPRDSGVDDNTRN